MVPVGLSFVTYLSFLLFWASLRSLFWSLFWSFWRFLPFFKDRSPPFLWFAVAIVAVFGKNYTKTGKKSTKSA